MKYYLQFIRLRGRINSFVLKCRNNKRSYFYFPGAQLVSNQPFARHAPAPGVHQPQVRGSAGGQNPPEMSVPAQPSAGLQPGQGRPHPWAPDVQGSSKCQNHRLWWRRHSRMGPGRVR